MNSIATAYCPFEVKNRDCVKAKRLGRIKTAQFVQLM